MKIDWMALGLVAVVSIVVTIIVVAMVAFGAKLLDDGQQRQKINQKAGPQLVGAYCLFGAVGLIILFGLYLIIPYFH